MPYTQDIWLTPITITNSNYSFRFVEDPNGVAVPRVVTIAAGTYYLHNDSSLHAASHLGLYVALTTAINAVATETYSFEVTTPTLSTGMTDAGLLIRATEVTEPDFQIDWGHASMTMDPAWFGWRTGKGGLVSSNVVTSSSDGGTQKMEGNYTVLGRWYTHTLDGVHAAEDKTSDTLKNTRFSHARTSDAVAIRWQTDTIRRYVIRWVKSPHIFNSRADDSDTAWLLASDLVASDIHNAWEDVWDSLSDLGEVLIVHNVNGAADLQVDPSTSDWEAVRLPDEKGARSLGDTIKRVQNGGEWYDIDISLWVNPTYANYGH